MTEILLYAIGVMYTPGPMNLLGLNQGINKKFRESIGFFLGVGTAMLILFLLFGYTGQRFIKKEYLLYISAVGCSYILYLGIKMLKANVKVESKVEAKALSFKDGLLMHLFNPKATLATLPIATIHFPASEIRGINILFISLILAAMGSLAPTSYALVGKYFGQLIKKNWVIKVYNTIMALLLIYVAFRIFWEHVYLVLVGIRPM